MPETVVLAGHILLRGAIVEGHAVLEEGRVSEAGEGAPGRPPDAEGLILPGLANHHVHSGDAAVPPPPPGMRPEDIFPPPSGYKHRMLSSTPEGTLARGMASYLDRMTAAGVVEASDFREGGLAGVALLERARGMASSPPGLRVWGRPARQAFDREELDALLARAHGLGLSAVRDWPWGALRDVVAHARARGRPVALHCSEVRREELSRVLELGPDHLVHMTHATRQDLEDLAAARVPVTICPRSMARFGMRPPVAEARRAGVRLRLGTDNAMLQSPAVLLEVAGLLGDPGMAAALPVEEALGWALPGSQSTNTQPGIGVRIGAPDLALFPTAGSHPTELLSKGRLGEATLVMRGGTIWRR
jgi:cytosine/adenosine deaminase-related metal-dependent hydrolase